MKVAQRLILQTVPFALVDNYIFCKRIWKKKVTKYRNRLIATSTLGFLHVHYTARFIGESYICSLIDAEAMELLEKEVVQMQII
jgi:hypothetical protein